MDFEIYRLLAYELYLKANYKIRSDIKRALEKALKKEKSKIARLAIRIILENAECAFKEKVPMCQDTGFPIFFIKLGRINFGALYAIRKQLILGIKDATLKGFLRSSLVLDPLKREEISPNIPPLLHIESSNTNKIEIELLVKGFGSENQTHLYLLNPDASLEEIIDIVINQVKKAGSRACPPYFIGIGIGGTAEEAVILSKKALLQDIDKRNNDFNLARLEEKIEKEVNKLGIGPLGVGGQTTCLGVKILTYPTHIAGLPLAVSLGCHAIRSAKRTIAVNSEQ